jgi:hypothetical protein
MSVVLLAIDESAADGTTSFDDQSSSNHTITTNGDAQWDTAQAPTGLSSSLLLDGTGDYLSIAAHANFGFGTGDFTVEGWFRYNANNISRTVFDNRAEGGVGFTLGSDGTDFFYHANSVTRISTTVPATGAWRHFAISRSSGSSKLFFDGTQVGSTFSDSLDLGSSKPVALGANVSGVDPFNGWLASIRIDKGTALYTANFTPPSLPLSGGSAPFRAMFRGS